MRKEFSSQTNIISHPDRFIKASRPDRHNLLNGCPGTNGLHPDLLIALKDCLGHRAGFP